jgi:hypothetical protein
MNANSNSYDEGEKLVSMIETFVKAIDEGKEDELRKKGFKVTKKPESEYLQEKLKDDEICNSILGDHI